MNKAEYKILLKSKYWHRKRMKILRRDKFTCQRCKSIDLELHVHHKLYIDGRKPWEYGDKQLITLCKSCHKITHDTETIPIYKNGSLVKPKPKKQKESPKKIIIKKTNKQRIKEIANKNRVLKFENAFPLKPHAINRLPKRLRKDDE